MARWARRWRGLFGVVGLVGLVGVGSVPSASAAAPSEEETARQIDAIIEAGIEAEGIEAVARADDATFLRRVSLDLIGDIPSPETLIAFLLDPAADKRDVVTRRLLENPQYGQNWARYWRDVILYRRVEDRALMVSNSLAVHLTERLNENASWAEIAEEFITATGDVRENGATGIFVSQDGQTEETTAEISRIFLGIQIQCAQCHDHPYDAWKREQFHELAAFFPRVAVRPANSATKRSYEVVANDNARMPQRPMANANRRGLPEHHMPNLEEPTKLGTLMEPKFFLTGESVPLGASDAVRRSTVADWVTEQEWFAIAFVNRMWSELVGQGFYEPVDDLGPEREPIAEEAVQLLAGAFAESGYDVKWLLRTIVATDAYQRQSRPRGSEAGLAFAANVSQPLRGDQLFSALLTTLELDEARGPLPGRRQGGGGYGINLNARSLFNTAFGYDPSVDRAEIASSIPQVLALMNSPLINREITAQSSRTMLGRLVREVEDDEALVTDLYLRTLSRQPTAQELDTAVLYFSEVEARRGAAEDFLWALLNSAEFRFRK